MPESFVHEILAQGSLSLFDPRLAQLGSPPIAHPAKALPLLPLSDPFPGSPANLTYLRWPRGFTR